MSGYIFSRRQLYALLRDTTELVNEYRDKHGKDPEDAVFAAIDEAFTALDLERELHVRDGEPLTAQGDLDTLGRSLAAASVVADMAIELFTMCAPLADAFLAQIPDGLPDDRTIFAHNDTRLTAGQIRAAAAAIAKARGEAQS